MGLWEQSLHIHTEAEPGSLPSPRNKENSRGAAVPASLCLFLSQCPWGSLHCCALFSWVVPLTFQLPRAGGALGKGRLLLATPSLSFKLRKGIKQMIKNKMGTCREAVRKAQLNMFPAVWHDSSPAAAQNTAMALNQHQMLKTGTFPELRTPLAQHRAPLHPAAAPGAVGSWAGGSLHTKL